MAIATRDRSSSVPVTDYEKRAVASRPRVFAPQSTRRSELSCRASIDAASLLSADDGDHRVFRQRKCSGDCRRLRLRKHSRVSRVSASLLRGREPTKEELEAWLSALEYHFEEVEVQEEEEEDTEEAEEATQNSFEKLRQEFLQNNRSTIEAANLGTLVAAPISAKVRDRFVNALDCYGKQSLVLGYHGTPKHNLLSIYERGLLVPGKSNGVRIAHGNAHGRGIYIAKSGFHGLSQSFLQGSPKMLICGVVDSTIVGPPRAEIEADADRKPRHVRRGGTIAHRSHRRPWRPCRALVPTRMLNHVSHDQNLHHVGGVMVICKQDHVVPFFVADRRELIAQKPRSTLKSEALSPSMSCHVDLWPPNNRQRVPMSAGARQLWHEPSGEMIWHPPSAEIDGHAREMKRRLARKWRDTERRALRAVKGLFP